MSQGNSPTHRFSGSYDSFYDPNFTAEISSRMQVPDRIRVTSEMAADLNPTRNKMEIEQGKGFMHVPDRILLTGGDTHVGEDDTLPELRLESSVLSHPLPGIQLVTPPHVITLDNHNFPSIEDDRSQRNKLEKAPLSSAVQVHNGYPIAPSTPPGVQSEDDVVMLRRQMRNLSRRVLVIEQENQQRQQREIVLYSVGIVYFVLKGLMWLHRHW